MIYIKFLKSLLWHKWYVFLAGLKTGVPLWRLIVHDWQKFTPQEFPYYARHFFGVDDEYKNNETMEAFQKYGVVEAAPFGHFEDERFALAWLHHENTAPHHWGYWIARSGKYQKPLPMPETYIREMIADWMGAERAYGGTWNMEKWLSKNWTGITKNMHHRTVNRLHGLLVEFGYIMDDSLFWEYQ